MRLVNLRALCTATVLIGTSACAAGYGGGPPGGPEDHVPPIIVMTVPDTNATRANPRAMIVQFDGVISERPAAAQASSLADLVMVSPRDGQPNVDWHRDNITIRPRHGWRANTTYTVTIFPGVADLRGNIAKNTTQIIFSTGTAIPPTTLTGTAFDWINGTPLVNAMVEAVAQPDTSLVYVGTTDSLGHFSLRGLTTGTYLVRAYDDQNRNHAIDRGEPFDSTTVALTTTSWTELLAFAHDSLGPKLSYASVQDSVTVRAAFDTPVNATGPFDLSTFTLVSTDSSHIAITAVTPVRQDTVVKTDVKTEPPFPVNPALPRNAPRPSKPLLFREVLVTVATPLRPKTSYILRATNIHGPTGTSAHSNKEFTVPAPSPVSPPQPSPSTRP